MKQLRFNIDAETWKIITAEAKRRGILRDAYYKKIFVAEAKRISSNKSKG